jgi:hypothetical protein
MGDAMTERGAVLRRLALGLIIAMNAVPGFAGRPTMQECLEGSDFIRNAALSRDAGIAGDAFIDRMRGDFSAIRAFPADLRWFVHDESDELFLANQARIVFEQPADPDAHRFRFLRVCIDRMTED